MKRTWQVTAALTLAACGARPEREPETSDSAAGETGVANQSIVYACPDGFRFSVRMRRDSAVVDLPARALTLPHVVAASGARYEGDGVVFRTKGAEAHLQTPPDAHGPCAGTPAATPWEEARLLGIEFRAIGQEPGWSLDVDRERWLRFTGDYGRTRVLTPAPVPMRDTADGSITYRASAEGRDLVVVIRPTPCEDVMSGEAFSHTVSVRFGETELLGCGRALVDDGQVESPID